MLRNILVPLDGSALSELALPYAAELARSVHARLILVRTVQPHHHLHPLPHGDAHPRDAADYLLEHSERLRSAGLSVDTVVAHGEPREALIKEIDDRQPDLVVMGTHGHSGLGRWAYGSVTETLISRARRPVMLVRAWATAAAAAEPRLRGKAVLVPLDGFEFGETALPVAAQLARTLDSELVLVEAVPAFTLPYPPYPWGEIELMSPAAWNPLVAQESAQAHLERLASRLTFNDARLRVSCVARVGEVTEIIRDLAASGAHAGHQIGLVVMATHARRGLGRAILGEDADAVLRSDELPLVLVHPTAAELHTDHVLAAAATEARRG